MVTSCILKSFVCWQPKDKHNLCSQRVGKVAWLSSHLAGMYRLDRFSIPFDRHFCGNWVTTKYDFSPILSQNLPVLNRKSTTEYNRTTNSEHFDLITFQFSEQWEWIVRMVDWAKNDRHHWARDGRDIGIPDWRWRIFGSLFQWTLWRRWPLWWYLGWFGKRAFYKWLLTNLKPWTQKG